MTIQDTPLGALSGREDGHGVARARQDGIFGNALAEIDLVALPRWREDTP